MIRGRASALRRLTVVARSIGAPLRLTPALGRSRVKVMEVTVQIPDDIATRLRAAGDDLPRRALEALVAEEYRQGHLNKPDLRRLLGFETSYEIDGFLKAH